MNKKHLIDGINALYPIDSNFSETNQIAAALLIQSMVNTGFDWRTLPNNVLKELYFLCYKESQSAMIHTRLNGAFIVHKKSETFDDVIDEKYKPFISREAGARLRAIEKHQQNTHTLKNVVCYFDGCCEPRNPGGNMGMGACVYVDEKKVYEKSSYIAAHLSNTNNIAEYLAFELVVDFLIVNNLTMENVVIKGDSMLVVNQMNGFWQMKKGAYLEHAKRCYKKLAKSFWRMSKPRIEWVGRDKNSFADELSKRELKNNGIEFKLQK